MTTVISIILIILSILVLVFFFSDDGMRVDNFIAAIWVTLFLAYVGFIAAVIYAGFHFVAKYW